MREGDKWQWYQTFVEYINALKSMSSLYISYTQTWQVTCFNKQSLIYIKLTSTRSIEKATLTCIYPVSGKCDATGTRLCITLRLHSRQRPSSVLQLCTHRAIEEIRSVLSIQTKRCEWKKKAGLSEVVVGGSAGWKLRLLQCFAFTDADWWARGTKS